jgi:cytoskeletal protein CcmA (bactofilin family)
VRVEGNIAFTGVLHVQGDILGDVSCDADIRGTLVVDRPGNVAGTIRVPHVIVIGRVSGPVHSSESIEIQRGAYVAGDVFYKVIDIHAGGVIEGMLTPRVLLDRDQVKQENRIQGLEPPAVKECDMPIANAVPAGSRFGERFGGARKLGGAAALLVAVVALVLVNRDPALMAPPVADVALKENSSAKDVSAVQSAPVGSDGLQGSPRAAGGEAIPAVPNSAGADTKNAVQASRPTLPEKDQGNVVVVQGLNPGKSASMFWAISKAPSVLYRKKRQDPADGARIDISQGATENIAIAKDEIFRVATGPDIQIFYQGRKVAQKTIESGAWMSFVPLPSSGASDME